MTLFELLPTLGSGATGFLIGTILGSFVTMLSYRLPRRQSIIHPRSSCPHCGHVLGWRDLVPILSWIFARGRCRHCRVSISPRYPMTEILAGILVMFAFTTHGLGPELLFTLALITLGLTVIIVDLENHPAPRGLVFILFVLTLAHVVIAPARTWTTPGWVTIGCALMLALYMLLGMGQKGYKIQWLATSLATLAVAWVFPERLLPLITVTIVCVTAMETGFRLRKIDRRLVLATFVFGWVLTASLHTPAKQTAFPVHETTIQFE